MGCRMSLKMPFLNHHIDFPENLRAISEEHVEHFHQQISVMKTLTHI